VAEGREAVANLQHPVAQLTQDLDRVGPHVMTVLRDDPRKIKATQRRALVQHLWDCT
jgi:hypothetical protein